MLWVPQKGILRVQHSTTPGLLPGTIVTTGATSATKGAAAELIAATLFDAYWVRVIAENYAAPATASQGALDLLLGDDPEDVIIPDMLMGFCGAANSTWKQWEFPLYIPAGSRISARAAGARVSTQLRVSVFLYGGNGMPPFRVGSKVTTYGMGVVPAGTPVTPGASGATGAWTQIVAATTEDHFALAPSFQVNGDSTVNNRSIAVEIGVGAATEVVVGGPYWYGTTSAEDMGGSSSPMPAFADIPAGTRLAMRAYNVGANDGGYNAVIHALS